VKIVVAGALANKPGYGGEAWVRLAWIRGLQALGADVLFVETLDRRASEAPAGNGARPGDSPHVRFFEAVIADFGLDERAALLSSGGESLRGVPREAVLDFAADADLLVNISGHLRDPTLLRTVARRAYVDLDPGFTQFWHVSGTGDLGLENHHVHFTVGENVGTAVCTIPTGGVRWLPLRQPVVLSDWPVTDVPRALRFTTVASWRGAYGPVRFGGRSYGLKVHEFRRFARLAEEVGVRVEVALDIHDADERDRRMLRGYGWSLADPRVAAGTPAAFREYVRGSGAELSVAQGIYVETRSGWFSDRSARYLATGRPVVVQDTGFGRCLPVGEGVVSFSSVAEAVAGAKDVVANYERHGRAARQIAEEYFDARVVLRSFLERALHPRPALHPAGPWPAARPNGNGSSAPTRAGNGRPARRGPGRRVLVSGMVAGVPGQGGASWAVLQYVLGLLRLGWDVHLVEELAPTDVRPPGIPLQSSSNARYFRRVVRRFGLEDRATLCVPATGETVGLAWPDLERLAGRSRVLLNLSGNLSGALRGKVPVRAYLDLDPAFTQLWQEVEQLDVGLDGHTHFVTVGLALGTPRCEVPTCGREWIRTLPPVVLDEWPHIASPPARDAWTTVANWRGYGSIEWNGTHLGQKAHAFRRLLSLPQLSEDRFEAALAIHPDEGDDLAALSSNGWGLVDPLKVAGHPERYRRFVQDSAAEVGVAKTGYVASRSGWFSDRSACYLASGRPVLAQDTGFSEHVPSGLGLVPFDGLDEAAEGVRRIRRDYPWHARAARGFAETYLDSDRVLGRLMREIAE
jgi:hypothetical protein